jgi:hypothetical protein
VCHKHTNHTHAVAREERDGEDLVFW